jgi:broad specificity phosphatase PhoE
LKSHIYLVRHAHPDWSRTDIPYHLPPGPPLTPQGLAEAQALADFLYSRGVQKVYSSPLERALHTAQIACARLSVNGEELQPVLTPGLVEWQPNEATSSVIQRCWPWVATAAAESQVLGPIALITHGGPIAALLTEMGLEASEIEAYKQQFDHGNPIPTAGAWEAQRNGHGWALRLAFIPKND